MLNMGRSGEGAEDGHCSLAMSRELGYPAGEAMALGKLGIAAMYCGDYDEAVRLGRLQQQITAAVPAVTRGGSTMLAEALIEAGTWPVPRASARPRWPGAGMSATC